jgi:hypothetical protein
MSGKPARNLEERMSHGNSNIIVGCDEVFRFLQTAVRNSGAYRAVDRAIRQSGIPVALSAEAGPDLLKS